MNQTIVLIAGITIGLAGGYLFSKSQAPPEGSLKERLELAEREADRYRSYHEAVEADLGRRKDSGADRLRDIIDKAKQGEDISADDFLATMKPWMRDMEPIFQRIQQFNAEDWTDSRVGQWTREYNLNESEQNRLRQFFLALQKERSEEFSRVVNSEQTGFVDFVKATEYSWRNEDGIEPLMEDMLDGEELLKFQNERLEQRVSSVQQEADRNLTRLDHIVSLSSEQHEQLFGVMARGAKDYRDDIDFDQVGDQQGQLTRRERDQEIRRILDADQRAQFDTHLQERRNEAESDMRRMGMTLPRDWDLLEGDTF